MDSDQPMYAAQAYPDIHFSPPVDFLFQETLLHTSTPLRWNVSARIGLRGLCSLIWIDTLRRGHNDGFLGSYDKYKYTFNLIKRYKLFQIFLNNNLVCI